LTEAFQFVGEPTDLGLDAVHVLSDGEIWFSVRTTAFSEMLGLTISAGDVLSDRGYVVRSAKELFANFSPDQPETDIGLDALYVWLGGEIWFSVETGFIDATLGWVQPGDILSDQGFVAVRNLDLTQGFSPLEELADFGLDGVWVVTDIGPPVLQPAVLEIPRLAGNDVDLAWLGSGRVYQVERASDLAGPYIPLTPILPVLQWRDRIESPRGSHFYRVSQW
jgi:hypothetical protein